MPFLSGQSVDLVPLDPDDEHHVELYRRTMTDEEMRATGFHDAPKTLREAREMLLERLERDEEARCAIVVDGEPVGRARVTVRDRRARRADLGYFVLPEFQGDGYASEAAKLLVDYAFASLNVHKIEAFVMAGNEPSQRILEKLGFEQEARLRDRLFRDGEHVDTFLFSLFAEHYRDR